MRSIYEFAWLNIAVAGSEENDGRLFMQRVPRLSRACRLPNAILSAYPKLVGPPYAYLSSQSYAKSVFGGFLTRRGWILQERILSPRTVYFGQEEVFWECSTSIASETIPWGWQGDSPLIKFNAHDLALQSSALLGSELTSTYTKLDSLNKTRGAFGSTLDLSPLYNYWYRLIKAYTSKELTKALDRLPAIFGLAQALHKSGMPYKIFSDCYQNGVWLPEPASFLWYMRTSPRPLGERLQGSSSYSWANWSDACEFLADGYTFPGTNHTVNNNFLEENGGHPATQAATITLASNLQSSVLSIPKPQPRMLPIEAQLNLAELVLTLVDGTIEGAGPKGSESRSQLHSRLTYSNDSARHPEIIIDRYPDQELQDWLQASDNTVWLLKLAIGIKNGSGLKPNWLNEGPYSPVYSSEYHDYGLILIPAQDTLDSFKEIQQRLEPWNIPVLVPVMYNVPGTRASTPPLVVDDTATWRHANERVNPYKLLGPHNTAFQRIGIYRARASTYEYYLNQKTTVFLA